MDTPPLRPIERGRLLQIWQANCLRCGRRKTMQQRHRPQAEQVLKKAGWKLRTDNRWLCPTCHATPAQERRHK